MLRLAAEPMRQRARRPKPAVIAPLVQEEMRVKQPASPSIDGRAGNLPVGQQSVPGDRTPGAEATAAPGRPPPPADAAETTAAILQSSQGAKRAHEAPAPGRAPEGRETSSPPQTERRVAAARPCKLRGRPAGRPCSDTAQGLGMEEGRSRDTGRDQQRSHAGREQAPRQRRGLRPFNPTDRRQAIGPERRTAPQPSAPGGHQGATDAPHGPASTPEPKTAPPGRSPGVDQGGRLDQLTAGSSRRQLAAGRPERQITSHQGEGEGRGENTHPPRRATSSGRRATRWPLTVARQLAAVTQEGTRPNRPPCHADQACGLVGP